MNYSQNTILIVEDESDLLQLCIDVFEIEGFNVIATSDGEEGLSAFEENHIDLVISDSHMPKMNGLELLESMEASLKKTPPFFLLTGDLEVTEEELKEKGATGLMAKPFNLDEILEQVKETLIAR